MIRAVLFDWGGTLAAWTFDPGLLGRGHEAGIEALGSRYRVAPEALTAAYAASLLPDLLATRDDELDYVDAVARLLRGIDPDVDDDAVWRFVVAEHAVWEPAHRLEPDAIAVLDGVRARGLLVGLVSNLFDPPSLSRARLAGFGVLERLDAVAVSAEVGKRKPNAAIFEYALSQLDVSPSETVVVGDRLREDVGGAVALGMRTILARWWTSDEGEGPEPDARAGRLLDVLEIVDKWQRS